MPDGYFSIWIPNFWNNQYFRFQLWKNKDGADLSKDILDFKIQSSKSEKKNAMFSIYVISILDLSK